MILLSEPYLSHFNRIMWESLKCEDDLKCEDNLKYEDDLKYDEDLEYTKPSQIYESKPIKSNLAF